MLTSLIGKSTIELSPITHPPISRGHQVLEYVKRVAEQSKRKDFNVSKRLTFLTIARAQILEFISRAFRIHGDEAPNEISGLSSQLNEINNGMGEVFESIKNELATHDIKFADSLEGIPEDQVSGLESSFLTELSKFRTTNKKHPDFSEEKFIENSKLNFHPIKRLQENSNYFNGKLCAIVEYTDNQDKSQKGVVSLPREFPRFLTIPPESEKPNLIIPSELLFKSLLEKQGIKIHLEEYASIKVNNVYPFSFTSSLELKDIDQSDPHQIDLLARRALLEEGNVPNKSALYSGHKNKALETVKEHNEKARNILNNLAKLIKESLINSQNSSTLSQEKKYLIQQEQTPREILQGHVLQSQVFKLEVPSLMPVEYIQELKTLLDLENDSIYRISHPVSFNGIPKIKISSDTQDSQAEKVGITPGNFSNPESIFDNIRASENGLIYRHPFTSFEKTVEAFIKQACRDKQVESIKISIYRTAAESNLAEDPLIKSLIEASQQTYTEVNPETGQAEDKKKRISVFLEARARGDTQTNIKLKKLLESHGIGVYTHEPGRTKVHAKLVLVDRREGEDLKRYVHVGTGNYNRKTAKRYTDLSYFSSEEQIGKDVASVFDYLRDRKPEQALKLEKLLVTPFNLKQKLINEILEEAKLDGHVKIKANELSDQDIINALYEAANAGCKIELIIRGACLMNPIEHQNGGSISIKSYLGEYLEHDRVYILGDTSSEKIDQARFYIGSCDPHERKVNGARTEVLAQIDGKRNKDQIIKFLNKYFKGGDQIYEKQSDGEYRLSVIQKKKRRF